jgi:hypothetical protein
MAFSPRDTRSVVDGGKKRPHNTNGLGNDTGSGIYSADVYQHGQTTHCNQIFSPPSSHDQLKNKFR